MGNHFPFSNQSYFFVGAALLSFSHYLAAVHLPVTDTDETLNFVEPIHFLLYGTGKQTWENCADYGLRSWLFALLYALPAILRYLALPRFVSYFSGAVGNVVNLRFVSHAIHWSVLPPRSVDVYFFQRIVFGQVACLAELFFVFSIHRVYDTKASGYQNRTSLIALGLLLTCVSIPHAGVSVLPTSFAMICYFMTAGFWIRSGVIAPPRKWKRKEIVSEECNADRLDVEGNTDEKAEKTIEIAPSSQVEILYASLSSVMVVIIVLLGWPFAGLIAAPMLVDLFYRHTHVTFWILFSAGFFVAACTICADSFFFCKQTFSAWNIVLYNVLGKGDAKLYGIEPWFYSIKTLLVNFNIVFFAALFSPMIICFEKRGNPMKIRDSLIDRCTKKEVMDSNAPNNSTVEEERITPEEVLHFLPLSFQPFHSTISEVFYMSSFFIWIIFWLFVPHKEERFMAPVYPYLILCATLSLSRFLGPSAKDDAYYAEAVKCCRFLESHKKKIVKSAGQPNAAKAKKKTVASRPTQDYSESIYSSSISVIQQSIRSQSSSRNRRWRTMVLLFLFLSGLISLSRGFALYHFYSGPQRMLYDAYPVLSSRAENKWKSVKESTFFPDEILHSSDVNKSSARRITSFSMDVVPSAAMQFRLCLGREWYRFPSSFFLDFSFPSPFPRIRSARNSSDKWMSFPSLYDYYSTEVPSTPLSTYGFLKTDFHGALPLDFFRQSPDSTGVLNFSLASAPSSSFWKSLLPNGRTIPRACLCASALVNDQNLPFDIQYVHNYSFSCDAIFDSVEMPPSPKSRVFSLYLQEKESWEAQIEKEIKESHFDEFSQPISITTSLNLPSSASRSSYRLLNVARTPFWCRVLYFPFGVTESCAVWRRLALQEKP